MTEELKQYEKKIKRKHRFGWTPKYEEEISTSLHQTVIEPIVVKAFEKLGWTVVYQNKKTVEAKRERDLWQWGNKITVTFELGKMKINSISLGNEIWDFGRNSKRVKLFIHVFKEIEKSFDRETLKELKLETEKTDSWNDYNIPESLPKPKERKEPKFWIAIIGGIITALMLGFILAFISVKGIYIIGLFESLVALAIGVALKQFIKLSNYAFYNNLHYLFIGIIILTYVSNQYFQYRIIISENNFESFSFLEFIQLRLETGLAIKTFNAGWIGWVLSWVLQLVITYFIGIYQLYSSLIAYQIERVPMEVVDYAVYHFVKEKTEDQVRAELSKKGWTEKEDQDEVFASIEAIQGATELNSKNFKNTLIQFL